ncbi:AAA family ATPase [Sphingomonas sp. Root241]|uniref:AAA family ATPase n=1 Tax=Sphingomonas sp. Root241 TaxID=1736501 RepID=UPI0009E98DB1|nr:DUF3696 domain-containing protein [Sphingomonas sp. Root241]
MISGLRLRNFRSLVDSGVVEFRPITLLLGQNSSGKSSVLRMIPLLKQSLRTRSSAPILWYGDFVDFGSIKDVKSTLEISGNVQIELVADQLRLTAFHPFTSETRYLTDVRLSLDLYERDEATRVRGFDLSVGSDKIHIELDSKQAVREITINGIDYLRLMSSERYRFNTASVIPQFSLIGRQAQREAGYYYGGLKTVAPGFREIVSIFQANLHGRISAGTVANLARRMEYAPADQFHSKIEGIYSKLSTWKKYAHELGEAFKSRELEEIRRLTLLAEMSSILSSFGQSVQASFLSSAYIGPARATGERYYRHQELAVDQIDAQGRNLPMFLYSLPESQRESFSEWLSQSLGYALKVTRTGGHLQIELRESSESKFHNLADMGYGFSQILPVLAQIWSWQNISNREAPSPFIAIEQPELHLHPAYQSRIADILCQAVNDSRTERSARRANFVVETHSEALINRLGELIYNQIISPEMVAIYIFQRDSTSEATNIIRSHFDSSGSLINWPLGFFTSFA